MREFNSHLQYYKIDSSFSIELQEINLNICEERMTEHEVRDENVSVKWADFKTGNTYFLFRILIPDDFL